MPGQDDPARVAAIGRDVVPHPGDGGGAVLEEAGEGRLRVEPVIRQHRHEPLRGERLSDEGVIVLRAVLPGAAVEEHEHRRILGRGHRRVDIEAPPRALAERLVPQHLPSAGIPRPDRIEECERRAGCDAERGERQACQAGECREDACHTLSVAPVTPNGMALGADS